MPPPVTFVVALWATRLDRPLKCFIGLCLQYFWRPPLRFLALNRRLPSRLRIPQQTGVSAGQTRGSCPISRARSGCCFRPLESSRRAPSISLARLSGESPFAPSGNVLRRGSGALGNCRALPVSTFCFPFSPVPNPVNATKAVGGTREELH